MKIRLRLISIILSLLTVASLFVAFPAFAAGELSGTTGSCKWSYDENTGILRISPNGAGYMPNFEYYKESKYQKDENGEKHLNDVPWYTVRRSIRKLVIDSGVKNIGRGAFYNSGSANKEGMTVLLPEGMTIGEKAFYHASISSINLSLKQNSIGEEAFYGASLPERLTVNAYLIGKYSFSQCTNVKIITFGSIVSAVQEGAFFNSSIRGAELNESLYSVGDFAFAGISNDYERNAIYIPDNVDEIGEKAFGYNCKYDSVQKKAVVGNLMPYYVIYTGHNTVGEKYAQDNGLSVVYNKRFFSNYFDADWTFEKSTGTLNLNCSEYLKSKDYSYEDYTVDTPDSSDEVWMDFVTKYGDKVTKAEIGTEEYAYTRIDSISDGINKLKELKEVVLSKKVRSVSDGAFKGLKKLQSISIESESLKLGKEAFSDCTALKNLSLVSSVKEIGDGAFSGCRGLEAVEIGDRETGNDPDMIIGVGVFENCSSLRSVKLGNMLTSLPERTFAGCSSLTEVAYSESLTALGEASFKDCSDLVKFTFGRGLVKIDPDAFMNTGINKIFIPEEITEIGSRAFCFRDNNGSVEPVENAKLFVVENSPGYEYAVSNSIPYEINAGGSMGNCNWHFNPDTGALYISGSGEMEEYSLSNDAPWVVYCYNIKSVEIGDGITSVSRKAFANDYLHLEEVRIGESVKTIGMQAFYNCPLKSVDIPESVAEIKKQALGYKENAYGDVSKNEELTMLVYRNSAAEAYAVENGINYSYRIREGVTGDCTWSFNTDNGRLTVSGIGDMDNYALSTDVPWNDYKDEIKTIVIEDGVKTVGNKAFMHCDNVTKVYLGNTLSEICTAAFANMSSLKSIYIPDSVKTIANLSLGFNYSYYEAEQDVGIFTENFTVMYSSYESDALRYANDLNRKTYYHREGIVGDDVWEFDYTLHRLTVSGNGSFECETYPWMSFADEIEQVEIDGGITEIPAEAFKNLKNLKKTYLSFYKLLKIGDSAFEGDSSLSDYNMPGSITSLGKNAFRDCSSISNISTALVTEIKEGTFSGCTSLEQVWFDDDLMSIGESAFENTALKEVALPERVEKIGARAFYQTAISEAEIPASVISIGEYAFGFIGAEPTLCDGFSLIALKDTEGHRYATESGLNWINPNEGDSGDCHWIFNPLTATLTVSGNGRMADGIYPSKRHYNLIKKIVVEDGVTHIGSYAFYGLSDGGHPITLKLSSTVESIGDYAFSSTQLKDFRFPLGVQSIGEGAFSESGLNSINLSDTVTEIGSCAFVDTNETSVYIPPTVKSIGEYAFGFSPWYSNFYCRLDEGEYKVLGASDSEAQRYADQYEGIAFEEYVPETEPSTVETELIETETSSEETLPTETTPTDPTESQTETETEESTPASNPISTETETESAETEFVSTESEPSSTATEPISTSSEPDTTVPDPELTINKTKLSLRAGKTFTLKVIGAKVLSWIADKDKYISVSSKGKVTALRKGSEKVFAVLSSGDTLTCKVTVTTNPVLKVGKKKFNPKNTYTVKKGKTLSLTVTGKASGINNKYSSTKKSVAKVISKKTASKLKIKGYKKGKATVTVKVGKTVFKIKIKVK